MQGGRKKGEGCVGVRVCVCLVAGTADMNGAWRSGPGGRAGIPRPFLRSGVNAAAVAGRGLPSPSLGPHAAAVISLLVAQVKSLSFPPALMRALPRWRWGEDWKGKRRKRWIERKKRESGLFFSTSPFLRRGAKGAARRRWASGEL